MTGRTSRRKPPKTQTRRSPAKRPELSDHYWDVTQRPLQCLVFLLPMVLAYELGMALVHGNVSIDERPGLAAQQLLYWFFSLFGATGVYLPGFALIAVLLVWHIASRHPWKVAGQPLLGMAGESVLLAIPLLLLNELIPQSAPLQGIAEGLAGMGDHSLTVAALNVESIVEPLQSIAGRHPASSFDNLLLSIGAGIYEELVFRLIIISLLMLLLIDIGRLKQVWGVALAVILSSLLFAAHHYDPIGADVWSNSGFAFRAAAGAYLAAVFVIRGFGLAVGCHVFYDILAFFIV